MTVNQSLYQITARALLSLQKVLLKAKPDLVLVQGDTTTTFAAGLAAFYQKIPVGHVEAGLRSFNRFHPYPEEINRKITSHIAEMHFAPTKKSKQNLLEEKIDKNSVWICGNTVVDALFFALKRNERIEKIEDLPYNKRIIAVEVHRRESFGKPMEDTCQAIAELARENKNLLFVFPVHRNPNVQMPVRKYLSGISNVLLWKPLEYFQFVKLMQKAYIILTDSGGVQEEAPSLKVPVLVLREVTERPEAVEAGVVKVIGTDKNRIIKETKSLLENRNVYLKMTSGRNPYGDGKASKRITDFILWRYGLIKRRPKEFGSTDYTD